MTYKICVFAGTTEGRRLVEYLIGKPVLVTVCVATDYGKTLLNDSRNVTVHTGRLGTEEMSAFFRENNFDCIIDCTHPYAEEVTKTIKATCGDAAYIRLNRPDASETDGQCCKTMEEAALLVEKTQGNVLLTTGSKELSKFCAHSSCLERLYARVLPLDASLEACSTCGLAPSHIVAMQGPFSYELNLALLKAWDIKVLVTKNAGDAGGFLEKINAAADAGAACIIIGRPPEPDGLSYSETIRLLSQKFENKRRVFLISAGPGDKQLLTAQAEAALQHSDAIIGAKRITDFCTSADKPVYHEFMADKIAAIIRQHPEYAAVSVVMSGDIGFFSGAKKLYQALSDCEILPICGISSPIYLCAKLGLPWEDIELCSLHGRTCNFVSKVTRHFRVFALVGGENSVTTLCQTLCAYGLGRVKLFVGERLSYPDEKITSGTADELLHHSFDALSSVIFENEAFDSSVKIGIADDAFLRTDKIPMTKSEVRAVSIAKLRLHPDSIVYDIGAGTGSVSIECALSACNGDVYAIEKNAEAVKLIRENQRKFAADNVTVVEGLAPAALFGLPAPTHAFIGGSSGNLQEIIDSLLAKNREVRIVINAVTLETVAEATALAKQFSTHEIVQLSVAKARSLGSYQLMTAQNPVFIFTLQHTIDRKDVFQNA